MKGDTFVEFLDCALFKDLINKARYPDSISIRIK